MFCKTAYLFIILLSSYIYLMVNYPETWLNNSLYRKFLTFYGDNAGSKAKIKVLYNPGLRNLGITPDEIRIKAFIPGKNEDFNGEIKKALKEGYQALVECSAFDSFHTTSCGQVLAAYMYNKAYRIVIFDGGHHLPTLGLSPDIIIIPELRGYAAHSYMHDAIKVETVVDLAKETGLNTVIVSVPRWALVKDEINLEKTAARALNLAFLKKMPSSDFYPCADKKISKINDVIFVYVGSEYHRDIEILINRIKALGLSGVNKGYLAFDYKYTDRESAHEYAKYLQEEIGIPLYIVNEPYTVFNVLWGKDRCTIQAGP